MSKQKSKIKKQPLYSKRELELGSKKLHELRLVLNYNFLRELISMDIENRILKSYFNVGNDARDYHYPISMFEIEQKYKREIEGIRKKLLPEKSLKFELKLNNNKRSKKKLKK